MKKMKNVHIFNILQMILDENTTHYKEDFEIDKKIISRAWANNVPVLIWMSRPHGTYCYRENELFIVDSTAYNVYTFYKQQGLTKGIRTFAIELKKEEAGALYGNIYELDYPTHVRRVEKNATTFGHYEFRYEKGLISAKQLKEYPGNYLPDLGQLIDFAIHPSNCEELENALAEEKKQREKAQEVSQLLRLHLNGE